MKVFERGGGWSFRLRLEGRGNQQPITSPCQIQVTADVDAGLDFNDNGTPIIDPCGGGDPGPGPGTLPGQSPVVINEGFFRSTGDRWVEPAAPGTSREATSQIRSTFTSRLESVCRRAIRREGSVAAVFWKR